MRKQVFGLGLLGATAMVGALIGAGCGLLPDDCHLLLTCAGGSGAGSTSGTGGTGSGGTGTGGDDGGPPPSCIPSTNSKPVADSCGAFVSPTGDDTTGKGTKEKPFKSFKTALAMRSTVYACAGATPFVEAVTLDKAATLFGALDCASWAYDATKKTELKAGADEITLSVANTADGSAVEDFAIIAADAAQSGGSSIAVVVDGVAASFTRTDIAAGNGKDGDAGTTPTDPVGPADPNDVALKGNDGKNACVDPAQQFGGAAKENALCPAGSGGPIGGKGGSADTLSGSNGDVNPATSQTALGGGGQPSTDMGAWSCGGAEPNGGGDDGTNGTNGTPGTGAQGTVLGSLGKTGYVGLTGTPGGVGMPGQGGGGGGGAKGKSACAGASGGGGGAGGCGGKGGTGGKAGGASIGIVSLGAKLTFDAVVIKAGVGGKGGEGAVGQGGGVGGAGGKGGVGDTNAPATLKACNGGDGGQGGFGGQGGGGRGGHAIGIAHTGNTAPAVKGVSFTKGTPGKGGTGDNANGNMGDGAGGVGMDVQGF